MRTLNEAGVKAHSKKGPAGAEVAATFSGNLVAPRGIISMEVAKLSTPKEELYRIIDALPDKKLAQAKRILERLLLKEQFIKFAAGLPIDDEEWTDEDEADLNKALKEIAEGKVRNLEDVAMEFGICLNKS